MSTGIDESENEMIDSRFEVNSEGNETQNALLIPKLTREHFGKWFQCQATNNNATQPSFSKVTIELNRKFGDTTFLSSFLSLTSAILVPFSHFPLTFSLTDIHT